MTVQFVGAQSGENGTGSTTVSVNAISGVQAGDLIFAIVAANDADAGDNSPTSGPSGFTELFYQRQSDTYPGTTLWVKEATSSEPGSYQWTMPFSNKHAVSISAYRNAAIWGSAIGYGTIGTPMYNSLPPGRPLPNMWLIGGGSFAQGTTITAGSGNLRTWATSSGGGNNTGKTAVWLVDLEYPSSSGGSQTFAQASSSDYYSTVSIWIASTIDSYGTISASGPTATDSIEYYPPINVTDAGQGSSEDLPPKPWRFFHDSFPDDAEWTTFTFDTYQSGTYEGEGYMHLVSGLDNGQLQKHRDADHYMYQNDWIGGPIQYFVTIGATGGYANGLYKYPSNRSNWMETVSGQDLTTRYQVSASGTQMDTGGSTSGHAAVYDLSPDGEGALWYTGSSEVSNQRVISFRRSSAANTSMAVAPSTSPFTRTSLLTGYWILINTGGGTTLTRSITYYKATDIDSVATPQTFAQSGPHTTASDKWLFSTSSSNLFALDEDIVLQFSTYLSEIEFNTVTSEASVRTYGVSQAYSEVDIYQIDSTDFWYVSACKTPTPVFIVRRLYRNSSGEWTIGPECMIWSRSNEFIDWYSSWTTSIMSVWGQMYSEKGRTYNDYDHMPIGMRVNTKNFLWSIPLELAKTYTPTITDGAHYGGVTPHASTYISVPRAEVIDSETKSTNSTQTTYTFPLITEDCLIVVFSFSYYSNTTWSNTNGTWTSAYEAQLNGRVHSVRYRIATPADSFSSTTLTSSNNGHSAHYFLIRGIDLADPINVTRVDAFDGSPSAYRTRTAQDETLTSALTLFGNGAKVSAANFAVSMITHAITNIPFSPEYMGVGTLSDVGSFTVTTNYMKSRAWAGGGSVTKRTSSWFFDQICDDLSEVVVYFNETVTASNDLSTTWNYTGKVFGPIHPEYYPVGTFSIAGTTTPGGQDYSATTHEWHYDTVIVSADLDIRHDVIALASVGNDVEFVWDLQGAIARDVEILFDTIAETLSAARSLDILWNDLVPIGRSREFPWGILIPVGASIDLSHNVDAFVSNDLSMQFNVGGVVSIDLALRHSIGVFVNRSLTTPWAINVPAPPKDLSVAWHVTIERPQYASLPGGVSSSYGQMAIDTEPRRNRREEQKTVT